MKLGSIACYFVKIRMILRSDSVCEGIAGPEQTILHNHLYLFNKFRF